MDLARKDGTMSGETAASAKRADDELVLFEVRDRIAWALDSLHNILQGKG